MHNAKAFFIDQHMSMDLIQGLMQKFGFSEFRGVQRQTLDRLKNKQSVLALMPTGTGKSLCYQFPALVWGEFVLVLSPLIALMQDQTNKAKELGIHATFINSSISSSEREARLAKVAAGKIQLLFVTPERFRKTDFVEVIQHRKPDLLVIDEAHCISQWGHDFRPDYSKIGQIRKNLGNPVTLALTATATPQVQQDILKSLDIPTAEILSAGVERPNLSLNVADLHGKDQKFGLLTQYLQNATGTTLIYTTLIDTLKEISRFLEQKKIQHLTYHDQMEARHRKQSLNEFIRNENVVMLATPAFGLGIDKPNIRTLIHFEMPGSIESYYQEVGRAGRDGDLSKAYLLFDQEDVSIQMEFIKWAYPETNYILKVFDLIKNNKAQVASGGFDYLREQLSFRNRRDFRPESSVQLLEKIGALEITDESRFGYRAAAQEPSSEEIQQICNAEMMKNQNMKLLEMFRWAQQEEICRSKLIYKYFGYEKKEDCGICDVCR